MFEGFKNFDVVPHNIYYPAPGIKRSIFDNRNETMMNLFAARRDYCNDKCSFLPCYWTYSITRPYVATRRGRNTIWIHVRIPQQSNRSNIVIARMSLTDYFTLASSCFGTWLGVSFMSIMAIVNKISTRRNTRTRVDVDDNRMAVDVHHHHHQHHHIHHHNVNNRSRTDL